MNLFDHINLITLLISAFFFMPLLTGLLHPISGSRIQQAFLSLLNSLLFILGLILAFQFTDGLFTGAGGKLFTLIQSLAPGFQNWLTRYQHDIAARVLALFVVLAVMLWLLELLTLPLHRWLLQPLSTRAVRTFDRLGDWTKGFLSLIWQLPKSVCLVLVLTLLLHFYTGFINNPTANQYIQRSAAYQLMDTRLLQPLLRTEAVQQLPVLFNDSFKKAEEDFARRSEDGGNSNYWKVPVIKYFNGMTLDEAIRSNEAIDAKAREIVGTATEDREKAYLLYQWVSQSIQYDKAKAALIVDNASHLESGSIVTFEQREGICFDYACLYISMCQATDLQVRFVTGLGYNGSSWGDHAWNQVYDSQSQRWLDVDTTFGHSGYNYFDTAAFSTDHKYQVVQGQW
ncbi:transglutaminase domain-containing protein [Aminipila butyrica]|uniref:Transglutaminase domain-containing protein n=1 Tax=Aminipila butyrica TaxID=433296 RepID=A0A858BXH4_9FIRM|nr:transglutaminase-like domain-containing protein [Aminipila butyrica]QIB68766.1 transglutaminase domain-containing protein [Aminipila butyrica]